MKPLLCVLLLMGIAAGPVSAADVPPITFYVQLVRGTDGDTPPAPDAHLVGPKLDQRLHNIFKWKHYWEIKRETVALKSGTPVRKRMSPEREIELAWTEARKMTVSVFTDGKITRKRLQSVDTTFYIAGGDRDASESWFIIVRKDNPDGGQDVGTKLAAMP